MRSSWLVLLASAACASKPVALPDAGQPAAVQPAPALVRRPAVARVVAIGDLHGDADAAKRALRLAGAIDDQARWAGGSLVVVQLGDQLDRGDSEEEILETFDRLAGEAAAAGGAFIALNGNHELMNAAGDFRYVTSGGMDDFGGEAARRAVFAPGGKWAKRFAERSIYAIVGDTVFVHGGVGPLDVDAGLERLDQEVRAWFRGERPRLPAVYLDSDSPIWTRRFSLPGPVDCATLRAVLARLEVTRMVIAHTVQEGGITSACDGAVWRIDVGLARVYGGPTEVLTITGTTARPLRL